MDILENKLVSIDKIVFQAVTSNVAVAAGQIQDGSASVPDVSSNVPTLTNYIETFREVAALLNDYRELLFQDTKEMMSIYNNFSDMDSTNMG